MEIHKKFKRYCQLKFKKYYNSKAAIHFKVHRYSIWRYCNGKTTIPEKIQEKVNNFFKQHPEKLHEDL